MYYLPVTYFLEIGIRLIKGQYLKHPVADVQRGSRRRRQSSARVASRLVVLVIAGLLEALLEMNLDAVNDKCLDSTIYLSESVSRPRTLARTKTSHLTKTAIPL